MKVDSMKEAQALVSFPLYEPPGTIESISVRLESSERWSSVHVVVLFEDVRLRVKQVFIDPWGWYGRPVNLIERAKYRCQEYQVPQPFIVHTNIGTHVGFYGCDYGGYEAGFLAPITSIEVRVLGKTLGVEGIRRFYEGIKFSHDFLTQTYKTKPLPLWDWYMRTSTPAWSGQEALLSKFKWYIDVDDIASDLDMDLGLPRWLEDLKLDSVGVRIDRREALSLYAIYRTRSLHEFLSIVYVERGSRLYNHPALNTETLDPDRFSGEEVGVGDHDGVYEEASEYGEARLLVEPPGSKVGVFSGSMVDYSPEKIVSVAEGFLAEFKKPRIRPV